MKAVVPPFKSPQVCTSRTDICKTKENRDAMTMNSKFEPGKLMIKARAVRTGNRKLTTLTSL